MAKITVPEDLSSLGMDKLRELMANPKVPMNEFVRIKKHLQERLAQEGPKSTIPIPPAEVVRRVRKGNTLRKKKASS